MARTLKSKATVSPSPPSREDSPHGETSEYAAQDTNVTEEKTSAPPPAKKSRKRKAVDEATTEEPSPKKRKRSASNKKSAKAASPPKPRRKRAKVHTTPPPSLPVPLTQTVKNKVVQVRKYMNDRCHGRLESTLDYDTNDHINVPESWLLAALTTMRMHYEVDLHERASLADAEGIIIEHFEWPFGQSWTPINWVALDPNGRTGLEDKIHQKINDRKLEGANLLEAELELHSRRELLKAGMIRDSDDLVYGDGVTGQRFMSFFETARNNISANQVEAEFTVEDRIEETCTSCGERRMDHVDPCFKLIDESSVKKFLAVLDSEPSYEQARRSSEMDVTSMGFSERRCWSAPL